MTDIKMSSNLQAAREELRNARDLLTEILAPRDKGPHHHSLTMAAGAIDTAMRLTDPVFPKSGMIDAADEDVDHAGRIRRSAERAVQSVGPLLSSTSYQYLVDAVAKAIVAGPASKDDLSPGDIEAHNDPHRTINVVLHAYDWTIDIEGRLCGLVAGDQGYESTHIVIPADHILAAANHFDGGKPAALARISEVDGQQTVDLKILRHDLLTPATSPIALYVRHQSEASGNGSDREPDSKTHRDLVGRGAIYSEDEDRWSHPQHRSQWLTESDECYLGWLTGYEEAMKHQADLVTTLTKDTSNESPGYRLALLAERSGALADGAENGSFWTLTAADFEALAHLIARLPQDRDAQDKTLNDDQVLHTALTAAFTEVTSKPLATGDGHEHDLWLRGLLRDAVKRSEDRQDRTGKNE